MVQILRLLVLMPLAYPLYRSQRHWGERVWRLADRVPHRGTRWVVRAALVLAWLALVLPGLLWFLTGSRRPLPASVPFAVSGLWLSSALFAWIGVKLVHGAEWLWNRSRAYRTENKAHAVSQHAAPLQREDAGAGTPANPSRRYFFQTAGYVAGAVPFVGAFYGFLVERLHYRVERIEIPIADLPPALDGLRIAQVSDIHMGGYMPREQVRRAVEMANVLEAELAMVTGDFITARGDPIEECVEELARLRAPLGIWGCNGNHEIYAGVEDLATLLFKQAGMRLLRGENAELTWRGAAFNLIGVDYQMSRGLNGRRRPMLAGVERLVRQDVPNILLSHNPNAFYRAAKLGIDLTLAGHTHGGQIQVEILHDRLNPARFMTEFTAGLYWRPASRVQGSVEPPQDEDVPRRLAHLYVNRGLGTIGTPVRFGAPPEITLLTLRRA